MSGVRGAEGHVQRHSQGQHVDVINSRPQSGNSLQKPGAADALETWSHVTNTILCRKAGVAAGCLQAAQGEGCVTITQG